MAQALDVSSGLGRREINAVRRRFTALAHERLLMGMNIDQAGDDRGIR